MAELEDPGVITQQKVSPQLGSSPTHQETRGFLTNLLSKAAAFIVFAAFLAVFPSQAPEFFNQSLLTRSWELLHLLLVGIAVSYGLFSRRNTDKEVPLYRAEDTTPRSYVSNLLQVSSVFGDDDDDDQARPGTDGSKLQVWSSHCHRAEPTVVVAHGSSVNGDSGAGRPLLLPVRSLRSRIPDEGSPGEEGSRPLPKIRIENGRLGGLASLDTPPPREGLTGSAVLPSPVPWRSRSGRMEVMEEPVAAAPPSCFLPPPAMDGDGGALRSPSFRRSQSSRPNSAASSPRKLSPSHSLSPELREKTSEDTVRKKTIYKPPPPPPPPPPSPPFIHRTPHLPSSKDPKRSFKDELKDFDSKPRFPVEDYSPGRSVRTVRPAKEAVQVVTAGRSPSPAAVATSPPSPAYNNYQNEEEELGAKKNKDGLEEAVVVETDDDDDDDSGSDDASELGDLPAEKAGAEAEADENEVDKKADEFIAKFREQIRLQRIESIRRSAGQRAPRSSTK